VLIYYQLHGKLRQDSQIASDPDTVSAFSKIQSMKSTTESIEKTKEFDCDKIGNNLPATSLVICSRNRPKLLNELIRSILQGEDVPTELIVVDDSDVRNDQLINLVTDRSCEIRYLWNCSSGLSRANNTGVAAARYDLIVFTQDDVLVTPTWFGRLVRTLLEAKPRTVVTGKVLPGGTEAGGGFAPSTKSDEEIEIYEGRIGSDVLYAQNMAFFRSTFEEIGCFDPNLGPGTPFPAAEDNDFALRLLEAGYRIVYDPHAVTYHRAWRSEDDYLWLHWNYGRGQGAFYAKYFSLKDTYMIRRMARDIIGHVIRFPYRILRDRSQARRDTLYVAGLFYGAVRWRIQRPGR
jgi:GT2 family glycosyltransferase